jgi:hypothetical protein
MKFGFVAGAASPAAVIALSGHEARAPLIVGPGSSRIWTNLPDANSAGNSAAPSMTTAAMSARGSVMGVALRGRIQLSPARR